MDFLIGIEGADFVMLASDCSQARSIVVMKTSKGSVYYISFCKVYISQKYNLCWAERRGGRNVVAGYTA